MTPIDLWEAEHTAIPAVPLTYAMLVAGLGAVQVTTRTARTATMLAAPVLREADPIEALVALLCPATARVRAARGSFHAPAARLIARQAAECTVKEPFTFAF